MKRTGRSADGRAELRLGLLAPSPRPNHVPLYRELAAEPGVDFTAIFASSGGVRRHDYGFGRKVSWHGDLLAGYESMFLAKADRNPVWGSFWELADLDVVAAVARRRFDVLWLHGYNFLTHVLASLTQRFGGRGLVLREEQTVIGERPVRRELVRQLGMRLVFSAAAGVYTGSENHRWLAHHGFREERLFFSPFCVDNRVLQEEAARLRPDRERLRSEFGVAADGGPVLLMVSRLIAAKRPLELLEVFRRVRSEQRCTLLVVGAGELEWEMRERVEAERIPDVVFGGFLGHEAVSSAYACADAFVLLSQLETWGLVVNEALNFELPVVVSDRVGSAADLVEQGRSGYVVGHGDLAGAAARLSELVADADLRTRMGARGRALVDGFNYERAARGVLDAARAVAR